MKKIALLMAMCLTAAVSPSVFAAGEAPADVPAEWLAQVQQDLQKAEYSLAWVENCALPGVDSAWHAPNRAHDFRTWFTGEGPMVVSRTAPASGWVWGLELTGLLQGAEKTDAPEVTGVTVEGNRISYRRDGLVEWYVNSEAGLEQGFTLEREISGNGQITLEVGLRGNLEAGMAADGGSIEFLTGNGVGVINFGKLSVFDATGKTLPATMTLSADGDAIELWTDTTGAVFPVTIDPVATSHSWSLEGNQVNAFLGFSVATAGDVNGDGYSDILVGAPNFDSGQMDEGKVFAYYGSAAGLTAVVGWTGESNLASANYGFSAATAGDVNGDGYSDVVIGAPYYENGQYEEGRVYVYLGSASGLAAVPVWTAESDQTSAAMGWSVAGAGDVNGDGYSDVIIGSPDYDNGQADEGRVFVFLGSGSGPAAAPAWTAESNQANSRFGYSVASAGDVNSDTYSDVIIGAPLYDNGQQDEGKVFVWHGSAAGLGANGTPLNPTWTVESDVLDTNFGNSVATAGDITGDGYADVVIGAYLWDNVEANEGRVYVYYGSATGLSTTAAWTVESNKTEAQMGFSVAGAGDVNGDGYADIMVGAPKQDAGQANEGRAYIYFGSSTGLPTAGAPTAIPSYTPSWSTEGNVINVQYGYSVAPAGDVNGDGFADVILGANQFVNGQTNEGRAYVFNGSASGLRNAFTWFGENNLADAQFGYSVANAGDVNGDGYADVIVGAPLFDNGQTDEGRVLFYSGTPTGLSAITWFAESNQISAKFGASVSSAGDVNSDGYADIIVGAPLYDGGQADEGRVFVWFGSAAGLGANGTPANADWWKESDQAGAQYGASVASAGDINTDGYGDIIIGAPLYDNGNTDEGRAYLYKGSATGPAAAPAWTAQGSQDNAQFGFSVASAGDVNADGYGDAIVGTRLYDNDQTDEGRASVFLGTSSTLLPTASWTAEGDQDNTQFGYSVAGAGDVNGDGYSDVVVGAPYYDNGQTDEGRAYGFHGSASGPNVAPAWTQEVNQADANFGYCVAGAGDVNGDGYADVVAGAPYYDNGQTNEGRAYAFHGSASGLGSVAWTAESDEVDAFYGCSVSTAGDTNGDGYADIITGAYQRDNGQINEGLAFMYLGNGQVGRPVTNNPRLRRGDDTAPINHLGGYLGTSVRVAALGKNIFGRSDVKLECEVKPFGAPFDGTGTVVSAAWANTGTAGAALAETVAGLSAPGAYHWRARLVYKPATSLFQQKSRWFTVPWNGTLEYDFRLTSTVPTAPANPGATAIGLDTITWTWSDNAYNETGYLVYVDAGAGAPVTLQATTAADTVSWQHNSLSWNTQYTFQVAGTNVNGDSPRTTALSAWTLAGAPLAPLVTNATPTTLDVAIDTGDGNPGNTEYAVRHVGSGLWVQADGTLGATPAWQTAAAWGAGTVTGLAEFTTHTFAVTARNGAGVLTAESPGTSLDTPDGTPPSGTVIINGGATYTQLLDVTLDITGDDGAGSGLNEMRFSEDNFIWGSWEPFATSKSFTFTGTDGLKTVYMQLSDLSGNVTTLDITDDITYDVIPPTGTVQINGGAAYTNSPSVSLDVTGDDSGGSGLYQMRFSEDNTNWTDWEAFGPSTALVLAGSDGIRTVYMQVSDLSGLVSTVDITDDILLDTVAPTGNVSINGGDAYANNPLVALNIWGDDAGSGLYQMRFSEDNVTWTDWEAAGGSKGLTLTGADGLKTVYVQLSDNAGNVSGDVISDDITLDTTPPTAVVTLPDANPTQSAALSFQVEFSEPVGTTFDGADVTVAAPFTGNVSVTGTDPVYTVSVVLTTPNPDGAAAIEIGADVFDVAANPFAGVVSGAYDVVYWPGFANDPAAVDAYTGDTVVFSAALAPGGSRTPTFQWSFDDNTKAVYPGPDTQDWTLADVAQAQAGDYWCTVTYGTFTFETSHAALQVRDRISITTQPLAQDLVLPTTCTFTVAAEGGYAPLHYQWKKDGAAIPASPDLPVYTIDPLVVGDGGLYSVEVSDSNTDMIESAEVLLTVDPGLPAAGLAGLAALVALAALAGGRAAKKR